MNPRSGLSIFFLLAAVLAAGAAKTPQKSSPAASLPAPELTETWTPVPPVIAVPENGVPSDAVVLFDGKNLSAWEAAAGGPVLWKIDDGALVVAEKAGPIRTKADFGDIQLHLEFRTPSVVKGNGQGRGNSGVFFMGKYELQILDSFDNPTYVNGQAGAIYKQFSPLVNASRRPGEWQVYDVVWIAPRFNAAGQLTSPARMTVFQNGVLVQYDSVLHGPTVYRGTPRYEVHGAKLPLLLQDHGNPTAFRNIWVRELPPVARDATFHDGIGR